MIAIKQAIEALEELVEYAETAGFDWSLDNARAALAALRSMPAEPVNDALNTLCKMLHSGEEVEGDDGLAMLVPMGLWNEAQEAIESLVGEDDTTPPPAPVLSDADQAHSPECNDEHEAACKFDPLDTAGNRHHEFRYAGYKGQPLKTGCTADQAAAYREGVRAAARPLTAATSAPSAEQSSVVEPVAWALFNEDGDVSMVFLDRTEAAEYCDGDEPVPLYTTPPTAPVLTDAEIQEMWDEHKRAAWNNTLINPVVFARAIEQAVIAHGVGRRDL